MLTRSSRVFVLIVSGLFSPVAAIAAAPSTQPVDEGLSVKAALLDLRQRAVAGDVAGVARGIAVPPTRKADRHREAVARLTVATEAIIKAVDETYGPDASRGEGAGLPRPDEIAAAKVNVEGAKATVTFDERVGGPTEPLVLLRKDGRWQLDGSDPDADPNADPEKEADRTTTLATLVALGLEQEIDDVRAKRVGPDQPVFSATGHAMGRAQAMKPDDAALAATRLAKIQDTRAPARAKAAAAAAGAAATAPVARGTAPATIPAGIDLSGPEKAAAAFARAIAAGDVGLARALMVADTPAEQALADAVAGDFIGWAKVRQAAAERIGAADARRLPWNDAGTMFIDRFQAADVHDGTARVVWHDDFKTADSPQGTERDLPFVLVNGQWKMSPRAAFGKDMSAAELYDTANDLRQLDWVQRRVADIKSGRLATFDAINGDR